MVSRLHIERIVSRLFKGKAVLLFGPRQVGKTTLAKQLAETTQVPYLWLNGDEADVREILANTTSTKLKSLFGNRKLIVIDEAQRIENIGLTLKLVVDTMPDVQVIATGSSAFELANKIHEPLTGRKFEFFLYPFSVQELSAHSSAFEEHRLLENRMLYGFYPEVVNNPANAAEYLRSITNSYLYKDLFDWEYIKKPALLEKILQALAFQVGNEVSYHELGQLVGADNETVERYIDLLEKSFVIFRLQALSRNLRNEIKMTRKIYFWDVGVRNAIIKNLNGLSLRQDVGAIWENFLLAERIKFNHYNDRHCNMYFWRTHAQQEIDYVEERDGKLYAYEFKWNAKKKAHFPKAFLDAYPGSITEVVNSENYQGFVGS